MLEAANDFGLFLNDHTFEVDLFKSGRHHSICDTIVELTDNGSAEKRALAWQKKPDSLDAEQLLKDIEAIAKGRFAQRLASRFKKNICPQYIRAAVKFLADKCR